MMISYFLLFIVLFFWLAFWSAQAGRSMASINLELDTWQDGFKNGHRVPELVVALTIGSIGTWGQYQIFDGLSAWWLPLILLGMTAVSFAGKESATVGYLRHKGSIKDANGDGVVDNKDARKNTLQPLNAWLSGLFGWKNGDEGYSWVWAFTKGFITTMPVFCIGAITQPIGREIASHAKGRLPWDSNFWMEYFGDGFGYSSACLLYIILINCLR